MSAAAFGQITGNVTFQGKPPVMQPIQAIANDPNCARVHKNPVLEDSVLVGPNGEFQNVVVSIKPAAGQVLKGQIPQAAAMLDQKGCMYSPHVVACMVGQAFNVKNSDKWLHNVHALCFNNAAFNFGQASPGVKALTPFQAAEIFKIKCDVHPWMSAWICVFDHPYFAVTDANGAYSIDTTGLPNGNYTLDLWQEKYGEQEVKVAVNAGKGTVDCQFK